MKDFKKFFEDDKMALIPRGEEITLDDFMDTLVGTTIETILNKRTFIGLYMGNKYGLSGAGGGKDKDVTEFVESLVRFVNRDAQGRGPGDEGFRPRVYETDEFKKAHNYDEYRDLDQQRRVALKARFMARREDDEVALANANQLYDDFTNQINNTQWMDAWRQARDEEDDYIKKLHNTPLNKEKLSPDGSKQYEDLRIAFDNLQRHYVIGVPESVSVMTQTGAADLELAEISHLQGYPFEFDQQLGWFHTYHKLSKTGWHSFEVQLAPKWERDTMFVREEGTLLMGLIIDSITGKKTNAEIVVLTLADGTPDMSKLPPNMGGDAV